LIRDIQNYDPEEWKEKEDNFHAKYNHADNGNASEEIAYLIRDMIE
jgi:hypothetical protein